jgi:hypothetical protein
VIERFKSLKNYLGYFGISGEEEGSTGGVVEFDFGLVLDN